MRRITINLFENERNALLELAQQERRDIRAQAAFLIRDELQRLGLLPVDGHTSISDQLRKGGVSDDSRN